jgi:hypothetical protein
VILRSVPASPYIVREAGLQVGVGKEYQSSTSRRPLYSAEHIQIPNRVLLLCSPCAPRLQVPCSASRVVPGAHRVVGPGTHRGSGPREVHTTVSTYNPQAYGPTPFSPRDSLGSCQSAEQMDYKRLIYLYSLTYLNPIYN